MTRTTTSEPSLLAKKRRYRRLMLGFIAAGVGGALVLRELLNYPLLSEAVYWVGILGFLAVWQGTSLTLFDERDDALERRASQLTLVLLAPILVIAASATRVLPKVSDYTVPSEISYALYGFLAVYAVFGVVYVTLRYQT